MTDAARWRGLIARLELRHFAVAVRLAVADAAPGPSLVISRDVPDRDAGAPTTQVVAYPLPPYYSDVGAAWYVRSLIAGNMAHEVDEALHLDGRRVFDPHAGGPR